MNTTNVARNPVRHGFTLVEVLIVTGMIGLLASLFLPVMAKVRAAANNTTCASNLRQMGAAWTMYVAEHRGRFPDYVWHAPGTPDSAWHGYWPGILEKNGVRGKSILCPAAHEPVSAPQARGFGTASQAWTGKFSSNGTGIRYNPGRYREGSYGYNKHLTSAAQSGAGRRWVRLSAAPNLADIPVFMDATYADAEPVNFSPAAPAPPPPNLRGDKADFRGQEHWRFLLARHGRGVNFYMADGSARWVSLEDTYTLTWKAGWVKYRLTLPRS